MKTLREECDELIIVRALLKAQCDALEAKCDALEAARDALKIERDAIKAERAGLNATIGQSQACTCRRPSRRG